MKQMTRRNLSLALLSAAVSLPVAGVAAANGGNGNHFGQNRVEVCKTTKTGRKVTLRVPQHTADRMIANGKATSGACA